MRSRFGHIAKLRPRQRRDTYMVIAWHQFRALAALKACGPGQDQIEATLREVETHRQYLATLAQTAPHNFAHRVHLIEAEIARLTGRRGEAHELYERSIALAREHQFLSDEALSNELAARFMLEFGSVAPARGYLQQAIFLYSYWGAAAKARQLESEFAELLLGFRHILQSSGSSSTGETLTGSSEIDLAVVIRASHAISRQIVLGELVQSLVRLAVEAAGAQRGLLLLCQDGSWNVVCEGLVRQEIELKLLDAPLGTYTDCPRKLVGYVHRTGEQVVLSHACEEGLFRADPYIQANGSKSILCLPVKQQNELKGLLYLENNLSPATFGRHHLDLLQLLAAQAAISIENAQLYNTLERRVDERTRALQMEVQERTRVQEELRVMATTDSLTGMPNRRHFLELAEREFERTRRYPAALTALMLDADHFKRINDTYGHDVGDMVLKALAQTLATELRTTEIFGRMGGEEFAVALPATPAGGAAVVAERLRRAIEATEVRAGEEILSFTVSIGVAEMSGGDSSFANMLSRADQALYQAKSGGRNRVESAKAPSPQAV